MREYKVHPSKAVRDPTPGRKSLASTPALGQRCISEKSADAVLCYTKRRLQDPIMKMHRSSRQTAAMLFATHADNALQERAVVYLLRISAPS